MGVTENNYNYWKNSQWVFFQVREIYGSYKQTAWEALWLIFFYFICRAHIGSLLTVTNLFTYLQCGILLLLFHPPTLFVVIATGIGVTS